LCVKRALGKRRSSRYKLALSDATRKVPPRAMSSVFLNPLISLIDTIFRLYTFVIIAAVVASWLIAFGVLNAANHVVRRIVQVLYALTEPLFRQVRKIIPPIAGLDLSPIVVLLAVQFVQEILDRLLNYLIYGV
jgi:YggT family protein